MFGIRQFYNVSAQGSHVHREIRRAAQDKCDARGLTLTDERKFQALLCWQLTGFRKFRNYIMANHHKVISKNPGSSTLAEWLAWCDKNIEAREEELELS